MTTRRVAEALGTGSASLYAHVASRDELIELMVDRIAAGITVPGPDPARWQEQLKGLRPSRPAGVGLGRRHRPRATGHHSHRARAAARHR
ncbi:MAG TPA: hypothetical protein VFQ68_06135, partial [Streptosporangiaceae bacterium]|nr:hypothetical protein [Streptosporangiaceae bacterium]